jgi:hypothetical protein
LNDVDVDDDDDNDDDDDDDDYYYYYYYYLNDTSYHVLSSVCVYVCFVSFLCCAYCIIGLWAVE